MYCVTNKEIKFINKTQYKVGWVGKGSPPKNYIECNSQDNIFFKEKYYSELTFHYWYWQNQLNLNSSNWIGFCQKRRFWIKKESINQSIDEFNYNEHFLNHIPEEYEKFNSIICESISVKGVKKMKLLKRGFKNLIKDPSIFFNKDKHSVKLHFDMHHGYGNISKAANLLPEKDRDEFLEYINDFQFVVCLGYKNLAKKSIFREGNCLALFKRARLLESVSKTIQNHTVHCTTDCICANETSSK